MPLSHYSTGQSSGQRDNGRSGLRGRTKHKKLDAICEEEYNRNHVELNEGGDLNPDSGVRRSTRVRRAPVLLDVSPSPRRKRPKLGKDVVPRSVDSVKSLGRESGGSDGGNWRSRLRTRGRNVGFDVKKTERESSRGKRKLFEEDVEVIEVDLEEELEVVDDVEVDKKEELEVVDDVEVDKKEELEVVEDLEDDKKEELEVVEDLEVDKKEELEVLIPKTVKSKKKLRKKIKATKRGKRHKENRGQGSLDDSKIQEGELVLKKGEESVSVPETESAGGIAIRDENAASTMGNEERVVSDNLEAEECSGGMEPSPVEQVESVDEQGKQGDQIESMKECKDVSDVAEIGGISTEQADNDGPVDKEVGVGGDVLKDGNTRKMDESKNASNDKSEYRHIKEGRRCGLCGRGNDGKPPKRLVQDNGESENEAYSGSSASEEPTYDTWDGFDDGPGWLGRLLGPINDRYGIAGIWVHQNCAVWSPEVYFAGLGCLKNVRAALCRGRALKCTRCGRRGATIGCRVDRCPKTYHLACARANGCIFDHRKFLIACTDHRHHFQPSGAKYLARIKKLRARKMMWETRKRSNDALRKDIDAEERWLENCGEDEEFLKRENKRLHRDLLRIAPMYIGGSDSAGENSFQGWESVAGLTDVIRCMKEVVILPLLYPELFDNLGLTPPRGILLHGYPGTGKTLVVRALIGACARGDKQIAYFARKGADCLGKYVGDAERQLRLLFQVAERCQPSIIFFDEIDGLAPVRTRQQDQTHSSVVSTLLALMDGLKSRGSVVVIGATNRPEAVDPALRRPGRFDREVYFPLPSIEDRASILSLHTQKWPKPITGPLLEWMARKTSGYAGADLQALCTQAAMNALKRNFPLQEVLSIAEKRNSGCKNIPLPSFTVEERDWLEAFLSSPMPCSRREAGNAANDVVCSPLPVQLIPCLLQPLCSLVVSLCLDERLSLPLPISKAGALIKNVMISALDKKKMPIDRWWLHVDHFLQETSIAYEVKKNLTYSGILCADHGLAGSCDSMDHTGDNKLNLEHSIKNNVNMHNGRLPHMSFALTNKSGFRVLISGNPRFGQRHLASCLLYCFIGNTEVRKIDMATISQEGHGDVAQGIAQILMRCSSRQSCVLYMPRIDLWAVEEDFHDAEKTDTCSTNHLSPEMNTFCSSPSQLTEKENEINARKNSMEMTICQANQKASYAWMSFIEQVESIGLSTSLTILATSEVPYAELPHRIREFFRSYQSKDSQSTPVEQTVPQFSLQIDGNFDHDLVINLSAIELLRNVVEQRVQLIHQRSHVHMAVPKGHGTYESIAVCEDKVIQRKGKESANEKGDIQFPESLTKNPQPNCRSLKGKSNLLLAISTFGYQILLYPHFAELCWVTSKLKEGPCADVSGPWRGWPFNSCIIRPNNSQDKVTVSSSSGGIKSKELSGLVRGLVAVGLSAYRGTYTSVREVSQEVRNVLEILIETINTKIQAGRNRYQFLRILSQVAYLEDMINNWAYALLSLEQDSPELAAKVTPASVGSLNSNLACEDRQQAEGEDCHLVVPVDGNDMETLKKSCTEIPAATAECVSLNDEKDNLDNPGHDSVNPNSEGSLQNHYFSDNPMNNSSLVNQPLHPSLIQENGTLFGPSESVPAVNNEVAGGKFGISEDLNKSTHTDSVVFSENGRHSVCEPDVNVETGNFRTVANETGVKLSDATSDKPEETIDINVTSSEGKGPAESGVVCLYQCCSGCISSLYHVTQKILVRKWGSNRSHWTVEDVHDAVSSLSVDLISAVRKCYMSDDFSDLSHKTSSHEKRGSLNLKTCDTVNRGQDVVPTECNSHSASQHETASKSQKLDLKFIFRDGVLVPMDPDKDISLHCKFENLCLCSVIELIVTMKGLLD